MSHIAATCVVALWVSACPTNESRPRADGEVSLDSRKRACVENYAEVDERFEALVRSVCAQFVEQDVPGIALAVVEKGRVVVHAELGVRCWGSPDPVTPASGFRLGSISKAFTATLALESLGAQLDEPIALGLRWPEGLDTPSLRGLLGHRSGLGEIHPQALIDAEGDWRTALASAPVLNKGGFTYSNTGYVVVGALLEQTLDRDYELSLRERFATVTSDPLAAPDPACGHLREGMGWQAVSMQDDLDFMPGDSAWLRPAGGVIASAIELAQSASGFAVLIGEPSETLPESLWRRPLVAEEYGLGIRTWTGADGQRVYAHSGASGHFSAELVWVPNQDLAVALVANAAFDTKPILSTIDALIEH